MADTTTINLPTNESYTLDLPGLGTCGYSWVWETDAEKTVNISHQYIVTEDPMPGQRGIERFKITGVRPGTCTLVFKQIHSWEKDQPPLDVRRLQVNVR